MIALQFPGGCHVVKAGPSKAQLLDSAAAWLALSQTQLGSVAYWVECGDRTPEAIKSLDVLRSQLEHMRKALQESENAR